MNVTKLFNTLEKCTCSNCGQVATEVIAAEAGIRRGWFCRACLNFDQAIGRERLLRRPSDQGQHRDQLVL